MKLVRLLSFLAVVMLLSISDTTAQITTDTLGNGTSSSATRGPFQRSDTGSSSVYSRAQLMYSQTELATTLAIPSGATLSQINWDLGSTNVITATGTATLNIYMKNSMVTDAVIDDTWANITTGSTLVGTYTFDATTNNFPGVKGLMSFVLATPFVYTGNTLEVAVEWDCSGLTTTTTSPVTPNIANILFSGNGSLNWRWDATAHVSTLYRAGGSSAPTILNKLKSERVNTQFVYSVAGSAVAPSLPVTFQDTVGVDHAMIDFGDNSSVLAVDPTDPNNIVVMSEKKNGAQTWAGTVVADNGLVNAVPFTATETKMTVRVWSPDAGTDFLLKLEKAGTPADAVETRATTTVAAQWETLVFDFTNEEPNTPALDLTKVYDKIVFFPDFGNPGTGKVYYWDDVMMFSAPVATAPSLPVTFQDTVTIDHAMIDFGDNSSVLAVDPTDPNNIVVMSEKKDGAQTWAGTVVADNGLVNAVPFTATATKMSVRVWSPDAGTDFLLKLEKAGTPADAVETRATTTVAAQWETLVFDFTNEEPNTPALDLTKVYDKIVFFPDFGNPGTGKVYYWDDVMMDTLSSSSFDVSLMADFDIMPNPANNFVQLQFSNEYVAIEKTISVYNSVGQVVFTNVVNHMNSYEVNTSDFAKGMYYVTVQAEDGIKTKRLVVIH